MEWTPRPLVEHLREQERHNVTVITVGSKYEVYVRSPASSHMQTLKQPFQTLAIKWEVNIFLKKSLCVFLLALCCCELFYIYMCMYVDVNLHMWLYNNSTHKTLVPFEDSQHDLFWTRKMKLLLTSLQNLSALSTKICDVLSFSSGTKVKL